MIYLFIGDIMELIDGKIIQKKFLKELKKEVDLFGHFREIAVISTGDNLLEGAYFKAIQSMAQKMEFPIRKMHFDYISENKLLLLIDQLNADCNVSGILVMHPLIGGINEIKVRERICPKKDIEGLNYYYGFKNTYKELYLPCTALGIIMILEELHISLIGKNIIILNRSPRIGLPLLNYFLKQNVDVTICHRHTDNQTLLKNADIVISALGKPNHIDSRILKKDSIVIDAGMCVVDEKIVGDIKFHQESLAKYYLSPTNGVGSLTTMALANNIYISYYLNQEDKDYPLF